MKKLVLMSRNWVKVAASKTVGGLGDMFDNLFSGGVPFVPPPMPAPWSIGASMEHESLYRQAMEGRAGMMDGYGGQLLAQMMGYRPQDQYLQHNKPSILKEGKVSVQVIFTRIDKEHVLVEVECIQRIVHNNKELREVTANLIEEYAEQYVFGEQPKNPRAPEHAPSTMMKEAKA